MLEIMYKCDDISIGVIAYNDVGCTAVVPIKVIFRGSPCILSRDVRFDSAADCQCFGTQAPFSRIAMHNQCSVSAPFHPLTLTVDCACTNADYISCAIPTALLLPFSFLLETAYTMVTYYRLKRESEDRKYRIPGPILGLTYRQCM